MVVLISVKGGGGTLYINVHGVIIIIIITASIKFNSSANKQE